MKQHSKHSIIAIALTVALIGAVGEAAAFDHLEITVISPVMVDGHPSVTVQEEFDVLVRAVNLDGTTDTDADYIHAYLDSPDVVANLPGAVYLTNGETIFTDISFMGDGQPVRLRVADQDDGSVPFAEVLINCFKFVDHFVIDVPAGPKSVGDLITLTVHAQNDENADVRNFRDDVVLVPEFGHFTAGPQITVLSADFTFGVANVDVIFQGTDPALHQNTVTATNSVLYPGQAELADGTALVSPLDPGALDTIVLLLPGETLTPGISPGKSGTPVAQISGFAFNGIDVYATDQYWNPVAAGPYPTLTWSSDDADGGVILPGGGAMASNAELDQSAVLVTSGLRQMTVNATGAVTASSSSQLQLNPAGLDRFEFDYAVFDTTDVQATTNPFTIRVWAKDSFGNNFPYNGPVSMRARIGGTDESADYLITSTNTFVNGRLDALIQVTKRAFSVELIIDSNTGVVAISGDFQVNAGPFDRILMSYPGETWTPGLNDDTFSGNMGTPNPGTAGGVLTPVQLRAVDLYGNLVSGARIVTLGCPTGYFFLLDMSNNIIADHRITLNGPADYQIVFRTAGEQHIELNVGGSEPSMSGVVDISPNVFYKIAVVAPGETLDPGTFDEDGKLGDPSAQDAGVPFDVGVYATDYYYNPIGNASVSLPMDVDFASTDAAAVLPVGPQTMLSNSASFSTTLKTLAIPNQQTIVVTHEGGIFFGTTVVPVVAGALDHFDIGLNNNTNPDVGDALLPIPDHQAGAWLPNVTVIARDAFGNHIAAFQDSVTLSLDAGGNVLTPVRVSLQDGFGSGLVWGVWRNPLRITRAGVDMHLLAADDVFGRTGTSNAFTVFAGPYDSLQMLLPGEIATPGESPGKFGVPLPIAAGDTVAVTLAALDGWWNPVSDQPIVHLESSDHFEMVSTNDVALEADGRTDFDLFFKTATTQTLSAWELSDPAHADSSVIDVAPGAFYRLMGLLPGEIPDPGGPELDGKLGTPDPQIATLQFPLTVRAVDRYWNQVDVSSDNVRLISDDGTVGATNPMNNGQTLSNGEIIFPVALSDLGYVDMTVLDETDPTKLGQDLTVFVEQGAQYRITVPDTAVAGPPATFPMTVELVDEFGTVMDNAFHQVQVRALTPTLQPADGNLLAAVADLDSGRVHVPDQAYDRVEQIVLEISDSSGRLGYSPIIQMISGGLAYEVVVDDSAGLIAGPPAVFPVTVRLLDVSTGNQVDDDRFFNIEILDEAGNPSLGAVGTVEQRLEDGAVVFDQSYTRAENIRVRVWDAMGLEAQSGVVVVGPGAYTRLQLLTPGETPEPGVPAYDVTGKSGAPIEQRASEYFPLSVRATDAYWNLVDTVSIGRIHMEASDSAFTWPVNPTDNDVPFVNGVRDLQAFLVAEGSVGVTASDLDNPGFPGQTVHVPTGEPYVFEITTPATAQTGGVPGFSMTVRLLDPDTGALVEDAFQRLTLTPYRADYSAASGDLGLTEAWFVAGVAVINDQSYSALEDMVVVVNDDHGRQGTSDVIHMETTGLYYRVTVPDEATVGGPETFPLELELVDGATNERVTSRNSVVSITVYSAGSGLQGGGVLGSIQQLVSLGHAVVPQTYTLAEEIYFQVSDGDGISGVSNSCRMLPDGFKQVQLIAPGETPQPGADDATGKTGDPLVQVAGEPFTVEVRAVDQFWNPVTSLNDGALEMDTDVADAFAWLNPGDYHAPFVNGWRQVDVVLDVEGNLTLLADDVLHPEAGEGHVVVPVVEATYEITVPDTAFVGPPATFPVGVRLVNPGTGELVPSGARITLHALGSDFQDASGELGLTQWTLLQGEAEITTQNYGYSEDIYIHITDDRGREAASEVIAVIPMGVTYAIDTPDTVVAGEPWTMKVSRVDVVTGRKVSGYDETFEILAINAASGDARPLEGADPAGVIDHTYGATVEGEVIIESQAYDRAELIRLRVIDENGGNVLSDPILVRAARASVYTIDLQEPEGLQVDRVLRPLDRVYVVITAEDASGNPTPNAVVSLGVLEGDARLGPTHVEIVELTTDADGYAEIEVRVDEYGNDDLLIEARVDELEPQRVAADVAGPPISSAEFEGVAESYQNGLYVSFDSVISVSTEVEIAGEGATIYFDVDGEDGPLPATAYTGPFTLADIGAEGVGLHELRFFAEEDSGVREALQTINLYTTDVVTLAQEISNRPNPFHAGEELTRVLFLPTSSGTVNITIYDLYGAVVQTHHMDVVAGLTEHYDWDGRNGKGIVVANGGYICRVVGPGFDYRRKIAVVK